MAFYDASPCHLGGATSGRYNRTLATTQKELAPLFARKQCPRCERHTGRVSHCPACRQCFCERCLGVHYRDPLSACFGSIAWSQLAWSESALAEQLARPGDSIADNSIMATKVRLDINASFLRAEPLVEHPVGLAGAGNLPECWFKQAMEEAARIALAANAAEPSMLCQPAAYFCTVCSENPMCRRCCLDSDRKCGVLPLWTRGTHVKCTAPGVRLEGPRDKRGVLSLDYQYQCENCEGQPPTSATQLSASFLWR